MRPLVSTNHLLVLEKGVALEVFRCERGNAAYRLLIGYGSAKERLYPTISLSPDADEAPAPI